VKVEEVVPLLILGLALLSRREEVRPEERPPERPRPPELPTPPAPPGPPTPPTLPTLPSPTPPKPPEVPAPRIEELVRERERAMLPPSPPKTTADIARQILEQASKSVWQSNPEVAQRVQSAIDQVRQRLEEELRRVPPKEYVPTPPTPSPPPRRVPEVLPVPVIGVREVE
jgi:hypothetical protein